MSSFNDSFKEEEKDDDHHHCPRQDALIVQFVCLIYFYYIRTYVCLCEKSSSQTLGGDKTQIRTSFTLNRQIETFLIKTNQSMQCLTDAYSYLSQRKEKTYFSHLLLQTIKDPICMYRT